MTRTENTNYTDRLLADEQNAKRRSRLTAEFGHDTTSTGGDTRPKSVPLREQFAPFKQAYEHPAFRAAERGDAVAMLSSLQSGFDVNRLRERTGDTVLHIAATRDAKNVVRVLIESGQCDYLIRDPAGRLASEKAYLFGDNPALARLLAIKERKQAKEQGVTLTRKP